MNIELDNNKHAIDLRSLKFKKFLTEWITFKSNDYTPKTNSLNNFISTQQTRANTSTTNENTNKSTIDFLYDTKSDKDNAYRKDGTDGSYTTVLPTDILSPMFANQTVFAQNGLYSGVFDLSDTQKVLLNGYTRNFFYTEDGGNNYTEVKFSDLPDTIQYDNFNFDGVTTVDSSVIKAFAWRYDGNYGTTKIYKTNDLKNWVLDATLPSVDGTNRMYIKDRRVYFHTGNVTYWWASEPFLALRSRSIDDDLGTWLVHWNIAHDRTTHDIPIPKVDQYGYDGIRFSTFAKYNGKIYDVLFYDRNNYHATAPDPECYQIWIKPIDGNSICTINIGHKFNNVYSGSAIVKGDYLYIILNNSYYGNSVSIYKVNLLDGSQSIVTELNFNALKYTEINSDDNFFYMKNETCGHYIKVAYDGSSSNFIYIYNESNQKVNIAANTYGWCGNKYLMAKQGSDVCLFEYIGETFVLKKRYTNPCPTVDITYSEDINVNFLIADNFGNKRLSSDNGKSWVGTSVSKTIDLWSIPFNSDDGNFQIGDKLTWSGMTLKHMRGSTILKQFVFPKIDYCITNNTYLEPTINSITGAYVGKNGKIIVCFWYRNIANTGSYKSWYIFDNFDIISSTDLVMTPPTTYTGEWGSNYGFSYLRSYFDDFNKALIIDGSYGYLINFTTKTLRSVRSSISYGYLENTITNSKNIIIQQNEFSGRMNSKDIVIVFQNEQYYQIKLPDLPTGVKIQRTMKYINGYFFFFYTNGMAYYANEVDIANDYTTAFKKIATGMMGKLNDICSNGTYWLAAGDKGLLRVSTDLITWIGYDICRFNTPDSNMFGFDINKENLKPTRSLDFKIEGSSKLIVDSIYKTIKTIKGSEDNLIKTENSQIEETAQSFLNSNRELTLNNKDVRYEEMNYPLLEASTGTRHFGFIPYNWRGKKVIIEFEARRTNSTDLLSVGVSYNDGVDKTLVAKTCKINTDTTSWIKYREIITLPADWSKSKDFGLDYTGDTSKANIKGMAISLFLASGSWDLRNVYLNLAELYRPLEFATDSAESYLFNIPNRWRGYEVELTYDVVNHGGGKASSIDIINGFTVDDWIFRGGETIGSELGTKVTKKDYLPYSLNGVIVAPMAVPDFPYRPASTGTAFFSRSLNSRANTLDFFQNNGITLETMAKTLDEITYESFGIIGDGSIITGASGLSFKNFKATIKEERNTFGFFESGMITFGDMEKFTFGDLEREKNIK